MAVAVPNRNTDLVICGRPCLAPCETVNLLLACLLVCCAAVAAAVAAAWVFSYHPSSSPAFSGGPALSMTRPPRYRRPLTLLSSPPLDTTHKHHPSSLLQPSTANQHNTPASHHRTQTQLHTQLRQLAIPQLSVDSSTPLLCRPHPTPFSALYIESQLVARRDGS